MNATVTAAEVRKTFVVENIDEATKSIVKTVSDTLDYDACVDLLEAAISTVSQEEANTCSMLSKMAWVARQCYLMGFVRAFQATAEAARMSWEELFRSPPQEG